MVPVKAPRSFDAHAWNMGKAKKKKTNMLGSGIPALHFFLMVVLFQHSPAAATAPGGFLVTVVATVERRV